MNGDASSDSHSVHEELGVDLVLDGGSYSDEACPVAYQFPQVHDSSRWNVGFSDESASKKLR